MNKQVRLAIVLVGTDVSENGQELSPQSKAITEKGAKIIIDNISEFPLIIPTGGNISQKAGKNSFTESELIDKSLVKIFKEKKLCYLKEQIIIENASHNTFDNAVNTLKTLKKWEQDNEQYIENFIVVSWQPHSGRVKRVFQSVIKLKKRHFEKIDYVVVDAPFGKGSENSQKRLKSVFCWYIWNYLCAYEATIFIIAQEFVRSKFRFS